MVIIKDKNNQPEFEIISNKLFSKTIDPNIDYLSFYDGNFADSYEIKALISDIFYKYYKAKIKVTFPKLLAMIDKKGDAMAALGLRDASENELFLEQYLDDKIENILKTPRNKIIEIGSLASSKKGSAKFLYITLAAYLKKAGYKYAVLTGTEKLQKYFQKAGLKPRIIADAPKSRLKDQEVDWGSYYKSSPKVTILDVDSGYFVLRLFLGISVVPALEKLYPALDYE